jgi:hypothetical protein
MKIMKITKVGMVIPTRGKVNKTLVMIKKPVKVKVKTVTEKVEDITVKEKENQMMVKMIMIPRKAKSINRVRAVVGVAWVVSTKLEFTEILTPTTMKKVVVKDTTMMIMVREKGKGKAVIQKVKKTQMHMKLINQVRK